MTINYTAPVQIEELSERAALKRVVGKSSAHLFMSSIMPECLRPV